MTFEILHDHNVDVWHVHSHISMWRLHRTELYRFILIVHQPGEITVLCETSFWLTYTFWLCTLLTKGYNTLMHLCKAPFWLIYTFWLCTLLTKGLYLLDASFWLFTQSKHGILHIYLCEVSFWLCGISHSILLLLRFLGLNSSIIHCIVLLLPTGTIF